MGMAPAKTPKPISSERWFTRMLVACEREIEQSDGQARSQVLVDTHELQRRHGGIVDLLPGQQRRGRDDAERGHDNGERLSTTAVDELP
jgi:hypothetical protein